MIDGMRETEHDEEVVELDEPVEEEIFDVQAWAEAYRADEAAQEEHARLAGVPFH
jgi:hypothetical protein